MSKFKVGQIIRWNKSPWVSMYQSYTKNMRAKVVRIDQYDNSLTIEWCEKYDVKDALPFYGWPQNAFVPATPDDPYVESDF